MLHKKLYRVDAELHAHPLDLLESQWPEVAMHSNTGTPFARFCSGSPVAWNFFVDAKHRVFPQALSRVVAMSQSKFKQPQQGEKRGERATTTKKS